MKWPLHLAGLTLAWFAMVAALSGCGESKVKVKGKLLNKGQAFTVAKETYVTLSFAADVEMAKQIYTARFEQATGGYEVELPPGKYRVKCKVLDGESQPIPTGPVQVFDLTKDQELDIDISLK